MSVRRRTFYVAELQVSTDLVNALETKAVNDYRLPQNLLEGLGNRRDLNGLSLRAMQTLGDIKRVFLSFGE